MGKEEKERKQQEKQQRQQEQRGSTTTKAIMKEHFWPNRVAIEIASRRLAFRCTMIAPLQFRRSPLYTSSPTTETSQMVVVIPGRSLLMRSRRIVRKYSQLRKHLKKVQPVIEFGFHSSSVEGGQTECAIVLRGHPLEVGYCERKVLSGFRAHSSIQVGGGSD